MGGGSKTTTSSTQQATATPEERAMEQLQLQQMQATNAQQTQAQQSGLGLINQLLTGQTPLPGFFGDMANGISPTDMAAQATELTRQALPGFISSGIGDSGEAYGALSRSIANSLVYPSAQFNVGAKQNLLNLALSGQAQVQSPIQNNTNSLASSLAGLRTINTNYTQTSPNPFLQSFQQSLGRSLGSVGWNGKTGFSIGGQ